LTHNDQVIARILDLVSSNTLYFVFTSTSEFPSRNGLLPQSLRLPCLPRR